MTRATRNDLGLALLVGLLVAVGPFTPPDEWGVSLAAGGIVAAGVFFWRRRRRARAPAPEADATPAAPRIVWPARVWLVLALFAALALPTFLWFYQAWTASIWINAHGLFVPPAMGYLGWLALQPDPAEGAEEASAWGFAFLVPGLALVALDAGIHTRYLAGIGIVLCLPGLSLMLLGARRTRALAVPLLVGFFMIPIPNAVATQLYLRNVTTAGVEPLLDALGFAVFRHGTALEFGSGTFVVSDACSGFATLYAAVAVAIVLACYSRSPARRATLLLAAIPLALACNVVRVMLLLLLVHYFGQSLLDTPLHEASGVATFWAVLLLLLGIAGRSEASEATT